MVVSGLVRKVLGLGLVVPLAIRDGAPRNCIQRLLGPPGIRTSLGRIRYSLCRTFQRSTEARGMRTVHPPPLVVMEPREVRRRLEMVVLAVVDPGMEVVQDLSGAAARLKLLHLGQRRRR